MTLKKWGYLGDDINISAPINTIDIEIEYRDRSSICETSDHIYFYDRSNNLIKRVNKITFDVIETVGAIEVDYLVPDTDVSISTIDDNTLLVACGGAYITSVNGTFISDFHVDLPSNNNDICGVIDFEGRSCNVVGNKESGVLYVSDTTIKTIKVEPGRSISVVNNKLNISNDDNILIESLHIGSIDERTIVNTIKLGDYLYVFGEDVLHSAYIQILDTEGQLIREGSTYLSLFNIKSFISVNKLSETSFKICCKDEDGTTVVLIGAVTGSSITDLTDINQYDDFGLEIQSMIDVAMVDDDSLYAYSIDDTNTYVHLLDKTSKTFELLESKPHNLDNPTGINVYGNGVYVKSDRFTVDMTDTLTKYSILNEDVVASLGVDTYIVTDRANDTSYITSRTRHVREDILIDNRLSDKLEYMEFIEKIDVEYNIESATVIDGNVFYINNESVYTVENGSSSKVADGEIVSPTKLLNINNILHVYCSTNHTLYSLEDGIATAVIDFGVISMDSVNDIIHYGDDLLFQTSTHIHTVSLITGVEIDSSDEEDLVTGKLFTNGLEIYSVERNVYDTFIFEDHVAVRKETLISDTDDDINALYFNEDNNFMIHDDRIVEYNKYDDIRGFNSYLNIPNLRTIIGEFDGVIYFYDEKSVVKINRVNHVVPISDVNNTILYGAYMYDGKDVISVGDAVEAAKIGLVYESIDGNRILTFDKDKLR